MLPFRNAGASRSDRHHAKIRTQAGPRGKKGILPVLFAVLTAMLLTGLSGSDGEAGTRGAGSLLPVSFAAKLAALPVRAEETAPGDNTAETDTAEENATATDTAEENAATAETAEENATETDTAEESAAAEEAESSLLIPGTYIVTEEGIEDVNAEAEIRLTIPPESNSYGYSGDSADGYAPWPEGPYVSAEAAVVMEASTGTVLYAKNMHEKLYPASTTKLLTALIAYEELPEDAVITVSQSAVDSVPWDGSNIGLDAGEYLGLEDMIYGVMVASANEGANALGEAVSGSAEAFAARMNEYAASLGCTDTHFVTASGLHEDDHYTSAYDMALIGRRYFSHEFLTSAAGAANYHIPPSAGQPDDILISSTNWFSTGKAVCTGFIGGKTGYTDHARSCLVTCAEKNGVRLICAVLREETPSQYNDTAALIDYGFDAFRVMRLSDVLEQAWEEDSVIPNLPSAEVLDHGRFSLAPEGTMVLTADQPLSSIICTPRGDTAADTAAQAPGSTGIPAGNTVRIGELVFTANGSEARAFIEYTPLTSSDLGFSDALSGAYLSAPIGKKADTALSAPVSAITALFERFVGFFVKSFGNVTYVHVPHILEVLAALLAFVLLIYLIRRILGSFHFGRRVY